jgi:hypothetical protein
MMHVHRLAIRAACPLVLALGLVVATAAHTPEVIFRAYLSKTLWHPAQRDVRELIAGLPPERESHLSYAGMAHDGAGASLQAARDAYRALFPDQPPPDYYYYTLNWPAPDLARVRDFVSAARATTVAETDELELLRCKVDLRAAKPDDKPALAQVRSCFDTYLAHPRPDALTSEARGWMARADFLLGNQASAAKFYLDELASPASNIRRERLLASLLAIEPTPQDLDVYLDTPGHALFIANRITNDESYHALAAPLIARLEQHRDLFGDGADSDALAIALMRAATRTGAPEATLRYAARVRADARARASAEYNWMLGAARFQETDYSGAETAFMNVMKAQDADSERRRLAGNGLVGVYSKLNRPLDQLWAAFEVAATTDDYWLGALDFDASYLLDVQLTDSQLETYLRRYGSAPIVLFKPSPFEKTSSVDAVRYALAVRHTRREEYAAAARLYDGLHSRRASRMREAERLLAATTALRVSPEQHLEALYDYAAFLSDHENGIFFNDMLWKGFQTEAFVYRNPDTRQRGWGPRDRATMPDDERTRLTQIERRLRDDQEEYWRAYKILNGVVEKAGPTPLGKRAAAHAITCLRRMNTDRFGHIKEIHDADIRLSSWLIRNKN